MSNPVFWYLLFVQMVLGAFDILFHHELTETLAWRRSQKFELILHAVRNLFYAAIFLLIGCFEVYGLFAIALIVLLAAEIVVTLIDFVEEDRTRRLPATERVTHTLLAINYGALLALAAPVLFDWAAQPTGVATAWHGWWSLLTILAAPGLVLFAAREFAAARNLAHLTRPDAARLVAALPPCQTILVTGATGFVGKRLVEALIAGGHRVIALVRDTERGAKLGAPITLVTALDQIGPYETIDAIVNLAGEPLANGLWTRAKRRRILASRLRVTREVIWLIAFLDRKPKVLVNASAVGWYGLRGDEILDESSGPRPCFSHELCRRWEGAARKAEHFGVRVVLTRIGLVLSPEGGMLRQMLPAFEYGLGGPFGSGRHWMPWIERDDLVRLLVHAIATPGFSGPLNAVAPSAVRNAQFAASLGLALRRPARIAIPAGPLRFIAGDLANELLLAGQLVVPAKALKSGFVFDHPVLEAALPAMLGRKRAGKPVSGPAFTSPSAYGILPR